MSYLLALCEQFRLQRKISTLTAKQIRASHRKERMTKQIERVQKMYQKRHQKIEKMASLMQKQFTVNLYNSAGLGTQQSGWNLMSGGVSNFILNAAGAAWQQLDKYKITKSDKSEEYPYKDFNLTPTRFQEILTAQQAGKLSNLNLEEVNGNKQFKDTNITDKEYEAFTMCMQKGNQMQSYAQTQCQNIDSQYQQMASIWLEAATAQLDQEEELATAPLQEQELEWDLEEQSCETQLTDLRARLENIKGLVKDGVQNSAPKFGLG